MDLTTRYLGLTLPHPFVRGASQYRDGSAEDAQAVEQRVLDVVAVVRR